MEDLIDRKREGTRRFEALQDVLDNPEKYRLSKRHISMWQEYERTRGTEEAVSLEEIGQNTAESGKKEQDG